MRALIMAGGAGSRLGRGEKPLILICGKPMISFVADAFRGAGCVPVVAVSPRTTMTANWCRANGLPTVSTPGAGFVEDMVTAVLGMEEREPVVVSVCDIPGITPGIVEKILDAYHECGKDALSAWIPARWAASHRTGMPYHETIDGTNACPAGINILRGNRIHETQEEYALLLDEPRLGLNVNTPEDLIRAESLLE